VGARIFPLVIPTEVWDTASKKPCLVYSTSGVQRASTFCATDDLMRDSVSIDAYARTYDDARALAKTVYGIIDFKGTIGNTEIQTVKLDAELDLLDPEPGLYRRAMSFTFWTREF